MPALPDTRAAAEKALTRLSATALARAVREGQTTAREVVEAHVALLSSVAPRINAIVAERFDAARAQAAAADERVAAAADHEQLPPFLGVPFTVKESIAVEGMPNSGGVVARRELRSAQTAPAVERLLDAGAILLGVTNTSELCMWIESDNRVYGRTSNPYDPTRMAGGSSGGEGAAVGSGGSPVGVGSDIGGSIRTPAFCCGVFGHKPSPGLVPLTGAWPPADGDVARMLVNGPLARRAEDLMPVLRTIAGTDGIDSTAREVTLGDPQAVEVAGLRVLISEDAWLRPVSSELLAARERAAGALAAGGAHLERRSMSELRRAFDLYLATLRSGDVSAQELLVDEGAEALAWRSGLRRGGPHTRALRVLLYAERASARMPEAVSRRRIAAGRTFARELIETIGGGVLLHPPFATTAPRHGRTVGRPWWVHQMAVFNLAGVPVTQVPLGLGEGGLPLGVQVVAGPDRDHVSIAVALELERVFGGWVPPPNA